MERGQGGGGAWIFADMNVAAGHAEISERVIDLGPA